jgi:L-lactate dehydrogenase complex protein LldG
MDSRQEILDSIRRGLKQPSQLPAETASVQMAETLIGPRQSLDEKMERFLAELALVSGECSVVASESESIERIVAVLRELSVREIAVSGGKSIEGVISALETLGIRIMRPERLAEAERKGAIANITVSIVAVPYAIADTATLAIPFTGCSPLPYFLAETVVALVQARSLAANHFELFRALPPEERKNLMMITGPSRTADIEKILILGAHGPKRLIVILQK